MQIEDICLLVLEIVINCICPLVHFGHDLLTVIATEDSATNGRVDLFRQETLPTANVEDGLPWSNYPLQNLPEVGEVAVPFEELLVGLVLLQLCEEVIPIPLVEELAVLFGQNIHLQQWIISNRYKSYIFTSLEGAPTFSSDWTGLSRTSAATAFPRQSPTAPAPDS